MRLAKWEQGLPPKASATASPQWLLRMRPDLWPEMISILSLNHPTISGEVDHLIWGDISCLLSIF
jgi:hypothetical protein